MEVEVLYTHQIQKKNKAFRDGSIKITPDGAVLRDDSEFAIDAHPITAKFRADWDAGVENFHFEKHLVQVPSERPMFGGGQRADPTPPKQMLPRPEAAPFKRPRRALVPAPEDRAPASTAFNAPKRDAPPRDAHSLWDSPAPKVAKCEDPWGGGTSGAKDPQVGWGDATQESTADDPWAAWTKQNDASNDDDPWAAFLPKEEPSEAPPAPKLGPNLDDLLRARGKTFALPPEKTQEEEEKRTAAEAAAAWSESAVRGAGRNGQPIIGHESEEVRIGAPTNGARDTTTGVSVPPKVEKTEGCSGAKETKNTEGVTTSASWDGRQCVGSEELVAKEMKNTEGVTTSASWDGRQCVGSEELAGKETKNTERVTISASWDGRKCEGSEDEGSEEHASATAAASTAPFSARGNVQSSRLLGAEQYDAPLEMDFLAASGATTIRDCPSAKNTAEADRRRNDSACDTEFEQAYDKTEKTTDATEMQPTQWGGASSSSAWGKCSTPQGDPLALWNVSQATTHALSSRSAAPESCQVSVTGAHGDGASTSLWREEKSSAAWHGEKTGVHTALHEENREVNTAWQELRGSNAAWQETHKPSWSDNTWGAVEGSMHWSAGSLHNIADGKSAVYGATGGEPGCPAVENVQSRPREGGLWGAEEVGTGWGVEEVGAGSFHGNVNTGENRTSGSALPTNLTSPGGGRWNCFVE